MKEDLYGRALWDYFLGNPKGELTTTSDITEEDELPLEYLFRPIARMPALEKKALELARGRVLDVGAGAGSHSLELQKKGLEATALDISEGAIKVCRTRGIKNCIRQDVMRHRGEYDTILLLMNGAGMIGRRRKLSGFLKHLKSLLSPGGVILTDSSDIQYMYREEDGSYWIDANKDYYGDLTFRMHYGGETSEEFDWLYVDFDTLEKEAAKAGLRCEKIMDGPHFDYLARLSV